VFGVGRAHGRGGEGVRGGWEGLGGGWWCAWTGVVDFVGDREMRMECEEGEGFVAEVLTVLQVRDLER
jgi:hypothetical protein